MRGSILNINNAVYDSRNLFNVDNHLIFTRRRIRRKISWSEGAANKRPRCFSLSCSLRTHHYAALYGRPVFLHCQWLWAASFSRHRRLRSRWRGVRHFQRTHFWTPTYLAYLHWLYTVYSITTELLHNAVQSFFHFFFFSSSCICHIRKSVLFWSSHLSYSIPCVVPHRHYFSVAGFVRKGFIANGVPYA